MSFIPCLFRAPKQDCEGKVPNPMQTLPLVSWTEPNTLLTSALQSKHGLKAALHASSMHALFGPFLNCHRMKWWPIADDSLCLPYKLHRRHLTMVKGSHIARPFVLK
ncbi:hypothetical protein CEXT_3881 [Caerostris extrusa]|uniref:Uncharacterized protein n=1 Tax=Caerostris extrusa TaxID=172846 RepID=A0AAV4RKN2_CAEEX|nr:hypothetical protein CEXT_3881 [Caerostris extrusa]